MAATLVGRREVKVRASPRREAPLSDWHGPPALRCYGGPDFNSMSKSDTRNPSLSSKLFQPVGAFGSPRMPPSVGWRPCQIVSPGGAALASGSAAYPRLLG